MLRHLALWSCLAILAMSAWSDPASAQDAAANRSYAYAFTSNGGEDADGIKRLDSFIQQRLRDEGMLASGKGDGRVEVTRTHYRARSDGARLWLGGFAGRDKIASQVRVLDRSGKLIDTFEIDNSNITIAGSTAGMHEKHADALVARLKQVE